MDVGAAGVVLRFFVNVEDPRVERTKLHRLDNIVFITVCAVLCGADSWVDVAAFALGREKWLRTVLELPNGIPSHDTFTRVFARLDPQQFEESFQKWMQALASASGGRLVAVDGKTLRRSLGKASKKAAIHMVSAWCEANRLVLGQLATEEKSNEITAIPALLKMLDIKDAVVTIDAMGCQKAIAEQIVQQGGHYVLAVKENQPSLHDAIANVFAEVTTTGIDGASCFHYEDREADHGRIETRRICATEWFGWYDGTKDWPGLRTIVQVEARREIADHTSTEHRYYITDLPATDAKAIAGYIRGHWAIENKLHWSLDVAFREDDSRMRTGHSAENFSRVRRIALNLLARDKTYKFGKKTKRFMASLDNDYMLKLLCSGI